MLINPASGPQYTGDFLFEVEKVEPTHWRTWFWLVGWERHRDGRRTLMVCAPGVRLWERPDGS